MRLPLSLRKTIGLREFGVKSVVDQARSIFRRYDYSSGALIRQSSVAYQPPKAQPPADPEIA
jgi:hypothetical protein